MDSSSSPAAGMCVFVVMVIPHSNLFDISHFLFPVQYIAFRVADGDVYVSTRKSARNMSYQGITTGEGKVDVLLELTGQVCVCVCVCVCVFVSMHASTLL